jgi:hypothetical protein
MIVEESFMKVLLLARHFFDAFGPYPIVGNSFAAGTNQGSPDIDRRG